MRRPVPAELVEINNDRTRYSKKYLSAKQRAQDNQRLGVEFQYKISDEVKNDLTACKKFSEIVDLYTTAKCRFVTSADSDILNRYCMAYSEWTTLVETYQLIVGEDDPNIPNLVKLDAAINKKNDILNRFAAILYLDPSSRSKIESMAQAYEDDQTLPEREDDDLFE